MLHVGKQESVGWPRMVRVVDNQVAFTNSVPKGDHFNISIGLPTDALVLVLAKYQRLAVFTQDYLVAARLFFCNPVPSAIVEDIAVLQNLHERRAFVYRSRTQYIL